MAFSAQFIVQAIDKYSPLLRKMSAATDTFRLKTAYAGEGLVKMGTKLGRLSTKLANLRTGFLAMMFTRGMKSMVSVSLEFEQALNMVESRGATTAEQMAKVRKEARFLGITTRFSAVQVAKSMALLRQRGYAIEEVLSLMPKVITMATAGNMDLEKSALVLTGTMKTMQMNIAQAERVTDVFAVAAANSALGMEELNAGLINFAPLGKSAGLGFEEMAAMVAAFSEGGVMGARAGTLLMNSVRNIVTPTKKAIETLNRLKIPKSPFIDVRGNIKDFTGFFEALKKAGASAADIFSMFQIRGAKATAVMVDHTKKVRELVDAYKDQIGAAQRMADIMNKGVIRAAFEASSAWVGMSESIAKSMEPTTIGLMEMVDAIASYVAESPKLQKAVGWFMFLGTIVLYIVTLFGVLAAAISGIALMLGITLSAAAIGAGFGIVGMIVGIIAIVAMAIAMWDDWIAIMKAFFTIGMYYLKEFGAAIKEFLLDKLQKIVGMWEKVKGFFGGDTKHELTSTATSPGDLRSSSDNAMRVDINGAIDVNDRTGGSVSSSPNGGNVPMNIMPINSYAIPGGSW